MDPNQDIVMHWQQLMELARFDYTIREFPRKSDTTGTPLVLTAVDDRGNGLTAVKAMVNEPRQSDAFIRLVNEYLFDALPYAVNQMHLNMTNKLNALDIRGQYVGAYSLRPL